MVTRMVTRMVTHVTDKRQDVSTAACSIWPYHVPPGLRLSAVLGVANVGSISFYF